MRGGPRPRKGPPKMTRPKTKNTDPARVARVAKGTPACWRCKGERVIRSHTDGIHYEVEPCDVCCPAREIAEVEDDGFGHVLTRPIAIVDSEGAQVVRLADKVIAAANEHRPENAPYVREDLTIALCIAASGTTWKAELGRARVDGARTAVEALTVLLTIVKRYRNTTSRGA